MNWRTSTSPIRKHSPTFAEKEKIHLTVVGPEAPLAAGVVNVSAHAA
jgi:phosphoribosylamine-glycine ligase